MGTTPSVPTPAEPPPWFVTPPKWTGAHKSELLSPKIAPTPEVALSELIDKSSKFPRKFPVESVRCCQLTKKKIPEEVLETNINSTYPVIHEQGLYLCVVFLVENKKRDFYRNMTVLELIDRLLGKRAVAFLGPLDGYMLMDGTTGSGGWEAVGSKDEKPPLVLENCLSYDEMKLSALLSVSSHTVFINDGNRRNRGVFEDDRTKLEDDGVIIGLIGPRLHKPGVMEYQEIIKTDQKNAPSSFQKLVFEFYGDDNLSYRQLKRDLQTDRYKNLIDNRYFDKVMYCRRISLSIDTLLLEANDRAKKRNKMAYIHVVGLGLGVWKIYQEQDKLFMDTFAERLTFLSEVLSNVSDVCFAYIKHKMAGEHQHGDKIGKIKLSMLDKAGPHLKLEGEGAGKLLVVSYAWDSNALPGNEFWFESLHTSSDPAAASSTQVAELHNWHINDAVRGRNLRVATLEGLVTFEEYQRMHNFD